MKILLITNYWYPYNRTLRWIQLGRYLEFDVLTSKKPMRAFYDETLPKEHKGRVFRFGSYLPAVLSGIFLSVIACFIKADVYIFTQPPYTFAFFAWLFQKMGRKVILDIRDNADNINNHWKLITKTCDYFRKKVKHRTTVFQFLDKDAIRVLNCYNPELNRNGRIEKSWRLGNFKSRLTYCAYNMNTECGIIKDYRDRVKNNYAISSYINYKYLGIDGLPIEMLNEECINQPVLHWWTSAYQMKKIIERVARRNDG